MLLFALACSDPSSPDVPAPTSEPVVSSGVIGVEGGTLSLDNGTELYIPPGALEEEVEILLIEVEHEQTGREEVLIPALVSFEVEPALVSAGPPFELTLPDSMRMVVSSDGIVDGEEPTLERVHLARVPSDGVARFDFDSLAHARFQPARLVDLADVPMGPPYDTGDIWDLVQESCGETLLRVEGVAPSDIDQKITLSSTFSFHALWTYAGHDPAKRDAFAEATQTFQARTCRALYESAIYAESQMGITPHYPIALDLEWTRWGGPAGGSRSPWGIKMFFNASDVNDYEGFLIIPEDSINNRAEKRRNAPVVGTAATYYDILEWEVAHELFHDLHDRANGDPGDLAEDDIGDFLTEGGADAFASEIYDKAVVHHGMRIIQNDSIWSARYDGWFFWSWAEWGDEQPARNQYVLARLLRHVGSQAKGTDLQFSDLVTVLSATHQKSYDKASIFTDFGAATLYARDYEWQADRYPDVRGFSTTEHAYEDLWGDRFVPDGGTSVHYAVKQAEVTPGDALYPLNVTGSTTSTASFEIDLWTVRQVAVYDRTVNTPDGSEIIIELDVEQGTGGVRVYFEEHLVLSHDGFVDTDELRLHVPRGLDKNTPVVIVLASTGVDKLKGEVKARYEPAGNHVSIGGRGFQGSVTTFEDTSAGITQDWQVIVGGGVRFVARDAWLPRLYASSHDGWIAAMDEHGNEFDWDDDATTTDTGATTGISYLQVGLEPRGLASLPLGPYVLVALEDGMALVNTEKRAVVHTFSQSDLGMSSEERPYDLEVGRDGTVWVTVFHRWFQTTERVLAIDGAKLIEGTVSYQAVDTGPGTNTITLALSPDGGKLAVAVENDYEDGVAIIDTASRTRFQYSPGYWFGDYNLHGDFGWDPTGAIQDVAWSIDGLAVYSVHVNGHANFTENGVVRRCELAYEECDHEVGFEGPGRGLAVMDTTAFGEEVWAVDDLGWVTPLKADYFVPSYLHSGQEHHPPHLYDGTGGCIENSGGWNESMPCTAGRVSLTMSGATAISW